MEKYLRNWRQELVNRGQYDAAIYIGDKALALTNNDADAFWLAQVHFTNQNYPRALALLLRSSLVAKSKSCQYLAAHCYIKQGKYDQALTTLGEQNPDHLVPSDHNSRRRLHRSHERGKRHADTGALRNDGSQQTSTRTDRIEHSEERERDREQVQKDIKFEAAMCHLRGLCYSRRNAFDRAKECFTTAVKIDVQCFEAFDCLMKNSLLTPLEELKLLEGLDFDSVATTIPEEDVSSTQEAAQFTKLLYTTCVSKYALPAVLSHATETLSTHYNLAHNTDLLLSRAETLYTKCRFQEALAITSSILNNCQAPSPAFSSSDDELSADPIGHPQTLYPLHLACLYETSSRTALFLLAHTLSQSASKQPYTYLAIGTYYLSTQRIPEARRFFCQASKMDPYSAAGWIGFGHTFAAEGEHDQAITAYSTAVRLFQGNHLPQLFIGMQHLALDSKSAAWEHCRLAWEMSSGLAKGGVELPGDDQNAVGLASVTAPNGSKLFNLKDGSSMRNPAACGDPLVLNELAVILYQQSQPQLTASNSYSNQQNSNNNTKDLNLAIHLFRQSLVLVDQLGWNQTSWVATRSNLAHALRRCRRYKEALAELDECVRISTGGGGSGTTTSSATADFGVAQLSIAAIATTAPDPTLLGNLHTSRGLVLLCLERAREAVVALHEAVRVLGHRGDGGGVGGAGASGGGGGVVGSGGAASQLLSRALEIWGVEMARREQRSPPSPQRKGLRRVFVGANGVGGGGRGKDNGKGKGRAVAERQMRNETGGRGARGGEEDYDDDDDDEGEGEEELIGLGLDGQAEDLLNRVLASSATTTTTTTKSRNHDGAGNNKTSNAIKGARTGLIRGGGGGGVDVTRSEGDRHPLL